MDATRKGKGGGRALRVLEFVENTVLSTSWLKLKPLPPRAKCFEISPFTFSEPVATVLCDGIFEMGGPGPVQGAPYESLVFGVAS